MPSDTGDLDKYLKSIGEKPIAETSTEPMAVATAGSGPSDEHLDWQQRTGKGLAKSLASTATSIPRAINAGIGLVSPETQEKLGTAAEQIPGVKRMEDFAAEPSTSWAESAGNWAGTGAQLLAGPGELEIGAKLASMFPKATFAGRGMGFVAKPRPWVHNLGQAAEYAGRGAVAGAVTDPNDPGAGAALGAATGGLTPVAGRALRSRMGEWMGGMIARHGPVAAINAVAYHLGVPAHYLWETGFAQAFLWHRAPLGQPLERYGRRGAQGLGQLMMRSDPRIPGAAAGSLGNLAEQRDWQSSTAPAADEGDTQ
jgi:hypothetical protein